MRMMEIDDEGLDSADRKLLAAIVQKFASGPVGVAALAAVLSEETDTIEDVHEPFLLRLGFIDRTPQGRIATDLGRAHLSGLGYEIPPPRRLGSRACRRCGTSRWTHGRRPDAVGPGGMTAPYVSTCGALRGHDAAAGGRLDAGTDRAADADPRRRSRRPSSCRSARTRRSRR